MISTFSEYYENLWRIQSENAPSTAVLIPQSETIYNIDLNKRTIETPEFLSVERDHNSETIFFLIDRFYDNVDLSTMTCVIQYINAKGEGRLYPVPFYDTLTYSKDNKILFPWCIEGEATKAAGDIQYSIRFYRINESGDAFVYNLNTLPTSSKILYGMNVLDNNDDYYFTNQVIEDIYARLDAYSREDLYWEEI